MRRGVIGETVLSIVAEKQKAPVMMARGEGFIRKSVREGAGMVPTSQYTTNCRPAGAGFALVGLGAS